MHFISLPFVAGVIAQLISLVFASDCQVSDWADWGECIGSCTFSMRVRNRIVLKPPFPETGSAKGVLLMEPCPPLYQIQQCIPTRCLGESPKNHSAGTEIFFKQQEERGRPLDGLSDEPMDEILNLALKLRNTSQLAKSAAGAVAVEKHPMNSNRTIVAKSEFRPMAVMADEKRMQEIFQRLMNIQENNDTDLSISLLEYEEAEYDDTSTLGTISTKKQKWMTFMDKLTTVPTITTTSAPVTMTSSTTTASTTASSSTTGSTSKTRPKPKKRRRTTTSTSTTTTTTPSTINSILDFESDNNSSYEYIGYDEYEVNENITVLWLNATNATVTQGHKNVTSPSSSPTVMAEKETLSPKVMIEFVRDSFVDEIQYGTDVTARMTTSEPKFTQPSPVFFVTGTDESVSISASISASSSTSQQSAGIAESSSRSTADTSTSTSPTGAFTSAVQTTPVQSGASTSTAQSTTVQASSSTITKPSITESLFGISTAPEAVTVTQSSAVSNSASVATGEPGSLYRPSDKEKFQFTKSTTLDPRQKSDEVLENKVLPVIREDIIATKSPIIEISKADVATGEPGSWYRWGKPDTKYPKSTTDAIRDRGLTESTTSTSRRTTEKRFRPTPAPITQYTKSRKTVSVSPATRLSLDQKRYDGPIGITLDPIPVTGESVDRFRPRVPIRFNISFASGNGKTQIQANPVQERSRFDARKTTSTPRTTTQNIQALLDDVHRPCGDTFGNRRCCQMPPRAKCPDGHTSQLAFRWFRLAGTDHCIPYNYGYCGSEIEQLEKPIKFQEECYELCFTDLEKRALSVFRDLKFKDGARVASASTGNS